MSYSLPESLKRLCRYVLPVFLATVCGCVFVFADPGTDTLAPLLSGIDDLVSSGSTVKFDRTGPATSGVELSRLIGVLMESGKDFIDVDKAFSDSRVLSRTVDSYTGNSQRLEGIVYSQGAFKRQSAVEIISNALDAVLASDGKEQTGRFGMGAFQALSLLKKPDDYVMWTSSKGNGQPAFCVKVSLVDGKFRAEFFKPGGFAGPGTRFDARIDGFAADSYREFIKSRFASCTSAAVYMDDELVNPLDNLYTTTNRPVGEYMCDGQVSIGIGDNGFSVWDEGIGMDGEDMLFRLLIPKFSSKTKVSNANVSQAAKVRFVPRGEMDGASQIVIQAGGPAIKIFEAASIDLPARFVLDLPVVSTDLTSDRQAIMFDEKFADALISAADQILTNVDPDNAVGLVSCLGVIVEQLVGSLEQNSVTGADAQARKQKNTANHVLAELRWRIQEWAEEHDLEVFPAANVLAREDIALEGQDYRVNGFYFVQSPKKAVFIHPLLCVFNPHDIAGFEKHSEWVSKRGYELWTVPFSDGAERVMFLHGKYIIIDEKYYSANEATPILLELLANPNKDYVTEDIPDRIRFKRPEAKLKGVHVSRGATTPLQDVGFARTNYMQRSIDLIRMYCGEVLDTDDGNAVRRQVSYLLASGKATERGLAQILERYGNFIDSGLVEEEQVAALLLETLVKEVAGVNTFVRRALDFADPEMAGAGENMAMAYIKHLIDSGCLVSALEIIENFSFREEERTFSLASKVIGGFVRAGDWHTAMELFAETQNRASEQVKEFFVENTNQFIVEGLSARGQFEEALEYADKQSVAVDELYIDIAIKYLGVGDHTIVPQEMRDKILGSVENLDDDGSVVSLGLSAEKIAAAGDVELAERLAEVLTGASEEIFSQDGKIAASGVYAAIVKRLLADKKDQAAQKYILDINSLRDVCSDDRGAFIAITCDYAKALFASGERDFAYGLLGEVGLSMEDFTPAQFFECIDSMGNLLNTYFEFVTALIDQGDVDNAHLFAYDAVSFSVSAVPDLFKSASYSTIGNIGAAFYKAGYKTDSMMYFDRLSEIVAALPEGRSKSLARVALYRNYLECGMVEKALGLLKAALVAEESFSLFPTFDETARKIAREGHLRLAFSFENLSNANNHKATVCAGIGAALGPRARAGISVGATAIPSWQVKAVKEFVSTLNMSQDTEKIKRLYANFAALPSRFTHVDRKSFGSILPLLMHVNRSVLEVLSLDDARLLSQKSVALFEDEEKTFFSFINSIAGMPEFNKKGVADIVFKRWADVFFMLSRSGSTEVLEKLVRYAILRPSMFAQGSTEGEMFDDEVFRSLAAYLSGRDDDLLVKQQSDIDLAVRSFSPVDSIKGMELASVSAAYNRSPDEIKNLTSISEYRDLLRRLNAVKPFGVSEITRHRKRIESTIKGQDKSLNLYLRELIQNSRKALAEKGITDPVKVRSFLQGEAENWTVSVEDGAGMGLDRILGPLLVYDVSTNTDWENQALGIFGIGFYTLFADSDKVRVLSSNGDGNVFLVELKNNPGGHIKMTMTQYEGNFQGTIVERIKDCNVEKIPFLESIINSDALHRYVGAVEDCRITFNGHDVNEKLSEVARVKTSLGNIVLSRTDSNRKRVCLKGLFVETPANGYFDKSAPMYVDQIQDGGFVISLPEKINLVSSRMTVADKEKVMPLIQNAVSVALMRSAVNDFFKGNEYLRGLTRDFFSNQNFSHPTSSMFDASRINADIIERQVIGSIPMPDSVCRAMRAQAAKHTDLFRKNLAIYTMMDDVLDAYLDKCKVEVLEKIGLSKFAALGEEIDTVLKNKLLSFEIKDGQVDVVMPALDLSDYQIKDGDDQKRRARKNEKLLSLITLIKVNTPSEEFLCLEQVRRRIFSLKEVKTQSDLFGSYVQRARDINNLSSSETPLSSYEIQASPKLTAFCELAELCIGYMDFGRPIRFGLHTGMVSDKGKVHAFFDGSKISANVDVMAPYIDMWFDILRGKEDKKDEFFRYFFNVLSHEGAHFYSHMHETTSNVEGSFAYYKYENILNLILTGRSPDDYIREVRQLRFADLEIYEAA